MNAHSTVRMEVAFCLLAHLLDEMNVECETSMVSLT